MGPVKLGSSSLTERYGRPSLERFAQAAPISTLPTKARWVGAFSLLLAASSTRRTFLALRLRVPSSPVKPCSVLVKVPMFAIVVLLALFPSRDHRGLDGDRKAGDERRRILQDRSAAEDARRATFLLREEWAKPRGRKLNAGIAARRSRRSRCPAKVRPS